MPRFKNRQEYEEWKAGRLEEAREKAERKQAIEKLMPHSLQSTLLFIIQIVRGSTGSEKGIRL